GGRVRRQSDPHQGVRRAEHLCSSVFFCGVLHVTLQAANHPCPSAWSVPSVLWLFSARPDIVIVRSDVSHYGRIWPMRIWGLIAAAALALAPGWLVQPARYDLLLKNGRVVDGTGSPWFRADVAIRGDAIAEVGHALDGPAARVIDVGG